MAGGNCPRRNVEQQSYSSMFKCFKHQLRTKPLIIPRHLSSIHETYDGKKVVLLSNLLSGELLSYLPFLLRHHRDIKDVNVCPVTYNFLLNSIFRPGFDDCSLVWQQQRRMTVA